MAGGAPGARWAQFAAAWKRGMGMWVGGGSQKGLMHVLLWESAMHMLLPPQSDPEEPRMGCSSGSSMELKCLLHTQ